MECCFFVNLIINLKILSRFLMRALKKSAELSDYTDFDMITQIFQCNFICVIGIESL
jgi:hypothetical protein